MAGRSTQSLALMSRMPDPSAPLCECGILDDAANDPAMPVFFDAQLNEYYIARTGELSGHLLIYHCPFCGGRAPKSKREEMFWAMTPEEMHRIRDITLSVETVSDAIAKFGEPDEDIPSGYGEITPPQPDKPQTTRFFRVLRYHRLSEIAVLDFVVHPEGKVHLSYSGKPKHA